MAISKLEKVASLTVLSAVFSAILVGCGGPHQGANVVHDCEPRDGLRVVCGIQAPEDLAVLPDQSGILISEYGHMGVSGGRLSIYDISSDATRTVYDLDSFNDLSLGQNLWGDANCTEPERFSPHGFDLSQRASGRWQLLVVNHGGGVGGDDSVEMFELGKDAQQRWNLQWRGCAKAEANSLLNDVAATSDGFIASQMINADAWFNGALDFIFKRKNGVLWRWSLQSGMQKVAGMEGVGLNGVVSDKSSKRYFVNAYGEEVVKVFDPVRDEMLAEVAIGKADNSNWDITQQGRLLVAAHRTNIFRMAQCMENMHVNCAVPFSIIELDVNTYEQNEIFHSKGKYFGGGTAAVRVGDQLYIGSFAGDRLLIAPVGHGVQAL